MVRLVFVFLTCLFLPFLLYTQTSRWIVSTTSQIEPTHLSQKQIKVHKRTSLQVWESPVSISPEEIKRALGPDNILFIEPDFVVNAFQSPNDPEYSKQWALNNVGQLGGVSGADIKAEAAWAFETGNDSLTVGVLDSGIDWQHPDLIDNIWQNLGEDADGDGHVLEWDGQQWIFDPGDINQIDEDGNGYVDDFIGWDFINDDNDPSDDHFSGHGTHVSGIIGAQGNNGIGITGVAWDVQLMGLKFLNQDGKGYTSDAIEALNYAVKMGAQVSNHSWGGSAYSQALEQAIAAVEQQQHMLVAAAGNNFGNDNDDTPLFPASYPNDNIIAVGAIDNLDSLATFSNIGKTTVDLFAPGKAILSTLPGGKYGYMSGSSMAAPMVSGALVLLYSHSGLQSVDQRKSQILQKTYSLPNLTDVSVSGGKLDLSQLIRDKQSTPCDVVAEFSLESPYVCYNEWIELTNQSTGATACQWFFNGTLISSQDSLSYKIKSLFGEHELKLVASNGICSDTITQKVEIKWLYLGPKMDTTHCGPRLHLPAPLQAPNYTYRWEALGEDEDADDIVIGYGDNINITESGEYRFTVTNNCGQKKSMRITVTLESNCVWPGDADANGTVNLRDYLTMGLLHGKTGSPRPNASTDFSPQQGIPWNQTFSSTHPIAPDLDYCHADADGNGQIQIEQDGNIVRKHFQGSVSTMASATSLVNVGMTFNRSSMSVGDTAFFDIKLESADNSLIQDVYGVALTLSYDMPLSQPIHILPQHSWLDDGTGIDTLVIQDLANKKLHLGITRLNQLGKSGNGSLAIGGITVMIDDIGIDSTVKLLNFFSIKISDALLIRSDGSSIPINNLSTQSFHSIAIHGPSDGQELSKQIRESWRMWPNPARDEIYLYVPEEVRQRTSPLSVRLVNLTGQTVWKQGLRNLQDEALHIQLPDVPQGYYWLKISGTGMPQSFPLSIRK